MTAEWCEVDRCPAHICGGPHREVRTTLGKEILKFGQAPRGEPVTGPVVQPDLTAKDALESLANCIAASPDDWGADRAMSWVYGIVLGWDCEEDHEHREGCGDAMAALAARWRWDEVDVARLRALRKAVREAVS